MKNIVFLLIIIVITISCSKKNDKIIDNNANNYVQNLDTKFIETINDVSYNKTTDNWLNRPIDNEFYYSKSLNIPIIFIDINKLNEARMLLQECFYIKLTDEEYNYFTGKIKIDKNNAYFLRSVNYSFTESGYRIYRGDKNNLLISHSVLGTGEGDIQKWPIIILYDDLESINEIFTNYSVAR